MAGPARELEALRFVFKESKLADVIQNYIVDALGATSSSDFVGLVAASGFEIELKTAILDHTPEKANILQLSRLRNAWTSARILVEKQASRRMVGAQDDTDDPLDETTHNSLTEGFKAVHQLVIGMTMFPSDSLLGRLYRENQRNSATLLAVRKVQSLYMTAMPEKKKETALAACITVTLGKEVEPIRSVYKYYVGLRILGNGYAITGQHKVDSKISPGILVAYSPFDTNLDFADVCLRRAHEIGVSGVSQLSWLTQRDEHTRSKMVELMRQGWPQGEALTRALAETEITWTIPPVAVFQQGGQKRLQDDQDDSAKKRGREVKQGGTTVHHTGNGQVICKKFNDQRGCSGKEKECPEKRRHVCDAVKKDGMPYLSASHSRANHK